MSGDGDRECYGRARRQCGTDSCSVIPFLVSCHRGGVRGYVLHAAFGQNVSPMEGALGEEDGISDRISMKRESEEWRHDYRLREAAWSVLRSWDRDGCQGRGA